MALSSSFILMQYVGLSQVLVSVVLAYVFYCLSIALYNITFHPLARIPGPKLRGAFAFPHYWEIYTGDMMSSPKALHDRYGDTVRVAPSIVSFNNAEAWQDIYGQRPGKRPIPQDKEIYVGGDGVADIILSNDADHARIRRLLSHAFSEGALHEQEPLQNVYFDLLIQKMYEKIDGPTNGKINIVQWFNFTAFDMTGDLCFGEPFDALKTEQYNPWIKNIVTGFKFARLFRIMRAYPLIGMPIMSSLALIPSLHKGWHKHMQYTIEKASRRLDTETDRRDIMSYILRHNDERGMSRDEIIKTSSTLIIAGSETTAGVLSGTIFYLLKNPHTLEKLVTEVRTAFADPAEITFAKLSGLRYLNACFQETFRIYPPVPMALARRTQEGGAIINGHFIPKDVSVGVHQWSAYHSTVNFTDPEKYIPERWLDNPLYESDKRNVVQPFSMGPRACLGRHLAMAQMRSILARMVWHFNISLCEESENWNRQRVYLLWERPELMIKLAARS